MPIRIPITSASDLNKIHLKIGRIQYRRNDPHNNLLTKHSLTKTPNLHSPVRIKLKIHKILLDLRIEVQVLGL